ncbi:MAG: RNA polymerase sigma factor RpoH [Halothiobacillaceae bacterium]|nr:RNA polymerase sigma factor RpoH [Halothiobacillaceae bacterium]
MLKSQTLPAPTGDTLQAYLDELRRLPLLDADEEYRLARRLRDEQDLEAARTLVLSHLRFVVHIARSYRGYGLPLPDLIQEGNIGLMKAVKRFEPDHKVRLVSFAVHWIRAEIHEFILRNWRIVRVATTKSQRKLFFRLRGAREQLGWMSQDEAERIAEELGVPARDVVEMESRLYGQDLALDPLNTEDEDAAPGPIAYLAAPDADPALRLEEGDAHHQRVERMQQALEKLDARSRDILQQRWLQDGEKATLHELAATYSVSAERIRQIEQNALRKLRSAIEA